MGRFQWFSDSVSSTTLGVIEASSSAVFVVLNAASISQMVLETSQVWANMDLIAPGGPVSVGGKLVHGVFLVA